MLTEEELKTNHEICLRLLDKFLEVCEKNDIEYYLAFGSALGAIRHKGFIPWDINIDVILTKDEYYKLDAAMKNEKLEDMAWIMPVERGRIRSLLAYKDFFTMASRPNIDVAVYANAPDNKFLRTLAIKCAYYNTRMYKLKNTPVKRSFPYNVLKVVASLFTNRFYNRQLRRIENYKDGKQTKYMLITTPSVFKDKETIERAWLGTEKCYGEFEGRKVRVVADPDSYLSKRYGPDYMTPVVWEDKGDYHHAK